jgi:hypothetical protein
MRWAEREIAGLGEMDFVDEHDSDFRLALWSPIPTAQDSQGIDADARSDAQ